MKTESGTGWNRVVFDPTTIKNQDILEIIYYITVFPNLTARIESVRMSVIHPVIADAERWREGLVP